MATVTLSPKFQSVIPKAVREEAHLVSGTEIEIIPYGNRIELIPLRPLKALKGLLKGINTSIPRDSDRL